jgi:hypothetical protein
MYRLQCEFLRWYQQNQQRFLIPLKIKKGSTTLKFYFKGIHHVLFGQVSSYDITLFGGKGKRWDILTDEFAAVPQKVAGGFQCQLCVENPERAGESFPVYPTRRALYTAEVFEPFVTWVDTELVAARWLGLYSIGGGMWAKLLVVKIRQKSPRLVESFQWFTTYGAVPNV